MGKKDRKEKCKLKLIAGVLQLIKKKVPVMLLWLNQGEMQKIGTRNILDWFDSLDDEVKGDLRSRMVQDIISMNANREVMTENNQNINDAENAVSILKDMSSLTELPRLPYPLSLMNKRQKIKYLSDRIFEEARVAGVQVIYGSKSWKPQFWLDDVWAWHNLTKPLIKITEAEFSGEGSYADFLENLIRSIFEDAERDPEKFVEDTAIKSGTLKKKQRARGINNKPTIIRMENRELDIGVTEREGTAAVFKPRRKIGVSPFKNKGPQTVVRNLGDQLARVPEHHILTGERTVVLTEIAEQESTDIMEVAGSRFQELLADRPRLLQLKSLLAIHESLPGMTMREMVQLSGLEESDLAVLVSSLSSMSSSTLELLGITSSLQPALEQISSMNIVEQEQSLIDCVDCDRMSCDVVHATEPSDGTKTYVVLSSIEHSDEHAVNYSVVSNDERPAIPVPSSIVFQKNSDGEDVWVDRDSMGRDVLGESRDTFPPPKDLRDGPMSSSWAGDRIRMDSSDSVHSKNVSGVSNCSVEVEEDERRRRCSMLMSDMQTIPSPSRAQPSSSRATLVNQGHIIRVHSPGRTRQRPGFQFKPTPASTSSSSSSCGEADSVRRGEF